MQNKANTDFSERSLSPTQSRWLWTAFVLWQLLPFFLILIDMAGGPYRYKDPETRIEAVEPFHTIRGLLVVGSSAIMLSQMVLLTGKVVCDASQQVFWGLMTLPMPIWFYYVFPFVCYYFCLPSTHEEVLTFGGFYCHFEMDSYLTMPFISLSLVLITVRLFRFQITHTQRSPSRAPLFQFTMRELIIIMLLVPLLFPAIRDWFSEIKLPYNFENFFDRFFDTDEYMRRAGSGNGDIRAALWTFSSLFLLDWTCFLLKFSLIVVPLLYLRCNTPMWVWSVLLAGVAIGQLILDRVSIHHENLFSQSSIYHFPFWIFSPIQVLFIFVSWYLLRQLGYQFTRPPKVSPASATTSTSV